MQAIKLLENRRKTYILDVTCNRFYFGEVHVEVRGQCSGQGISAPRKEGLSVYQWSVPGKKQARWLRKCLVNTPLKFPGFGNYGLNFIASVIPLNCATPLENTKAKKRDP